MTLAVQRLNEAARAALLAHFLALPPEDRRLRFGSSLSEVGIAGHVAGIDFERDAVLGVHDDRLALYDDALKAQVAASKGINAALERAASATRPDQA